MRTQELRLECLKLAQMYGFASDEITNVAEKFYQFVTIPTHLCSRAGVSSPATIQELEAILNSEDDREITIRADGTVAEIAVRIE